MEFGGKEDSRNNDDKAHNEKEINRRILPRRRGEKKCLPTEEEEEIKRLQEQRSEWISCIREYFVLNQQQCLIAVYNRDSNEEKVLFKLCVNRGNYTNHFGHREGSDVIFSPEEVLYLTDQGIMLLFEEDKVSDTEWGFPLSTQQIYALILGRNMLVFEHYLAYSSLRRQGFILYRRGEIYDDGHYQQHMNEQRSLSVTYDGWDKDVSFRKKAPPIPSFRLVICKLQNDPPSVGALQRLRQDCEVCAHTNNRKKCDNDSSTCHCNNDKNGCDNRHTIPLRLALEANGSLQFYEVEDIDALQSCFYP